MLIWLILFLGVIFWQSRPVSKAEGFYSDYMTPERTTAIKGVFILLIFLTPGEQYLTLSDSMPDRISSLIRLALGQSVVTAFFFYSGYGLMESLKRKGSAYLDAFPKMRILKTLVHFDLAVLLYVILAFALGKDYGAARILLSFIGWESVGNSAWFIFDITVAYLMFYLCFRPFVRGEDALHDKVPSALKRGAGLFTVMSVVFVVLMILFQESRYYNTFLCVAMGVWFSLYREPVEAFAQGAGKPGRGRFFGLLFGLAALYVAGGVALMGVYDRFEFLYIPLPLIFMMTLLLLTMVWRFDNPVLGWFGDHLFSVFILMRLPMILLRYFGLNENVHLFLLLAFAATVGLAFVYDRLLKALDGVLFKG